MLNRIVANATIPKRYARPAEQSGDFHAILNGLAESRDRWNRPTDVVGLSKFSDWLEEHGDPRWRLVQAHIQSLDHLGGYNQHHPEGPLQLIVTPHSETIDTNDIRSMAKNPNGFYLRWPAHSDTGLHATAVITHSGNPGQLEHEPTLVMHWTPRYGSDNSRKLPARNSAPVSFHGIMDPEEAKRMLVELVGVHRRLGRIGQKGIKPPEKLAVIAKLIKRVFPQTITQKIEESPVQNSRVKRYAAVPENEVHPLFQFNPKDYYGLPGGEGAFLTPWLSQIAAEHGPHSDLAETILRTGELHPNLPILADALEESGHPLARAVDWRHVPRAIAIDQAVRQQIEKSWRERGGGALHPRTVADQWSYDKYSAPNRHHQTVPFQKAVLEHVQKTVDPTATVHDVNYALARMGMQQAYGWYGKPLSLDSLGSMYHEHKFPLDKIGTPAPKTNSRAKSPSSLAQRREFQTNPMRYRNPNLLYANGKMKRKLPYSRVLKYAAVHPDEVHPDFKIGGVAPRLGRTLSQLAAESSHTPISQIAENVLRTGDTESLPILADALDDANHPSGQLYDWRYAHRGITIDRMLRDEIAKHRIRSGMNHPAGINQNIQLPVGWVIAGWKDGARNKIPKRSFLRQVQQVFPDATHHELSHAVHRIYDANEVGEHPEDSAMMRRLMDPSSENYLKAKERGLHARSLTAMGTPDNEESPTDVGMYPDPRKMYKGNKRLYSRRPVRNAKAQAPKGGWAELTPFGALLYKPGKFLPEPAIPKVPQEQVPQKKAEKESPKEGKSKYHTLAVRVVEYLAQNHPAVKALVKKK